MEEKIIKRNYEKNFQKYKWNKGGSVCYDPPLVFGMIHQVFNMIHPGIWYDPPGIQYDPPWYLL